MDFILYKFCVIIIVFAGFSFCGDPKDISSYDPEEFDVKDLLIDPHQSSKSNIVKEPSQHQPLHKKITPAKRRKYKSQSNRKLICLGITFRGNKEIPKIFNGLQFAKVNPNNLMLGELEMMFYEQGSRHPWRELEEFSLNEYANYWAHVCDYFWVKENPEDPRYRACYVKRLLFSDNTFPYIYYEVNQLEFTRAEVLRCSCHYFITKNTNRDSPSALFAVHKYTDNEYFILTTPRENAKNTLKVSDFWTNVMLPFPIK